MVQSKGLLSAFVLAASVAFSCAHAQSWPTKPIRMIVPFGAGGPTDVLARPFAEKLGGTLKQQVIIENRVGAGGNIGTELVAKADPDGYTLLFTASGPMIINDQVYGKLPYDPEKDFSPIGMIMSVPMILMVSTTIPVNNVAELVQLAKSRPGKLNFASGGYGTGPHIGGELFKRWAGIDIVHIPYKSGSQIYPALMSGEAQIYFDATIGLPYTRGGKLKAISTASSKRISAAPELPTMTEAGLPGVDIWSWYALLGPAGTSRPIVTALNTEINRMLKDAEFLAKVSVLGFEPDGGTPEQLAERIRTDRKRVENNFKAAGLRFEQPSGTGR